MFDQESWRAATTAAQLYLLPFGRPVRAEVSALLAEARQIEASQSWWDKLGDLDPMDEAVKRHEAAGSLPATVFPGFREADNTWSSAFVDVEFPEPPREVLRTIHRARLAGFEMFAATPAQAIKIRGIAEAARAARDRRAMVDPIIFGTLTGYESKVVVFGYYDTSEEDPLVLKALIDVLEKMNVE